MSSLTPEDKKWMENLLTSCVNPLRQELTATNQKLESAIARISALEGGSSSSATARSPESPTKRRHSSLGPVPGTSSASARDREPADCTKPRLWIGPFPYNMHRDGFTEHFEAQVKSHVAAYNPVVKAFNNQKSYSVEFANREVARSAADALKSVKLPFLNEDSNESVILRVRPDRSKEERIIRRALGGICTEVERHLRATNQWSSSLRMGTTGARGGFFISQGKRVYEIFKAKQVGLLSENRAEIEPVQSNLDC